MIRLGATLGTSKGDPERACISPKIQQDGVQESEGTFLLYRIVQSRMYIKKRRTSGDLLR